MTSLSKFLEQVAACNYPPKSTEENTIADELRRKCTLGDKIACKEYFAHFLHCLKSISDKSETTLDAPQRSLRKCLRTSMGLWLTKGIRVGVKTAFEMPRILTGHHG